MDTGTDYWSKTVGRRVTRRRALAVGVAAGAASALLAAYVGDLAESYEVQDGGLKLVIKLRPEAKWDPRDPTNSRPVDTEDVTYSWDRFESLSPFAAKLSYKASKGAAPI